MAFTPTFDDLHDWLQDPARPHGVLAYVDLNGDPETAFLAFSVTSRGELIFGTSVHSRKYEALGFYARVGFNVTDTKLRQTVQLQGVAERIRGDIWRSGMLQGPHYEKLGDASRRFDELPDQAFFVVTPTSIMFTDAMEDPWTVSTLR